MTAIASQTASNLAERLADMHTHTTHSDGAFTPEKLLRTAWERGLSAIAITDHDTASGSREALALLSGEHPNKYPNKHPNKHSDEHSDELPAEALPPIEVLSGIELSAFDATLCREYHILGYGFHPHHAALLEYEVQCRKQRMSRAEQIVAKLRACGLELSLDAVLSEAHADVADEALPAGVVGRQHIALALQKTGAVATTKQAFERYLGEGRPAFVEKWQFSVAEAIELIHTCGGVAVLAHPAQTVHGLALVSMVKAGLDGIETVHPSHTAYWQRYYEQFAKGYKMLTTGGSDFHGNKWGDGARFGTVTVPQATFEHVRSAAERSMSDDVFFG
jgi:3',5'-nucleoside bisphosphate phosphatase